MPAMSFSQPLFVLHGAEAIARYRNNIRRAQSRAVPCSGQPGDRRRTTAGSPSATAESALVSRSLPILGLDLLQLTPDDPIDTHRLFVEVFETSSKPHPGFFSLFKLASSFSVTASVTKAHSPMFRWAATDLARRRSASSISRVVSTLPGPVFIESQLIQGAAAAGAFRCRSAPRWILRLFGVHASVGDHSSSLSVLPRSPTFRSWPRLSDQRDLQLSLAPVLDPGISTL